ncbi:hypothetical protein OXPF_39680 [Oxobacter pfennigii]|uniref:Uncharacterized protein n=1 Tax=Oxobacter pfennigii TaxID=36849 RepID=A0A0P8WVB2_9CLOT|nr:hypothetical protein [Oxobacter pfennigii]KPU42189.1 hypothetical protein OXPF_39680 [Oxobacter pfennigii]
MEKINEKIEAFILTYLDYVQESLEKVKSGETVDTVAIYALGDAIRIMHHIRKISDNQ